jgi:hypothetical protein
MLTQVILRPFGVRVVKSYTKGSAFFVCDLSGSPAAAWSSSTAAALISTVIRSWAPNGDAAVYELPQNNGLADEEDFPEKRHARKRHLNVNLVSSFFPT